ncbi:MAG TPA: thioesterase family protein [Parachlamydiaceae bacterium]|nr:thioesterase family protein [Parachlamydiaceae bacterium]
MFITHNKVRMNDTDMAGILYFANQFRFVHDAWEDLVEKENISFHQVLYKENFLFVIVHAEADYYAPLNIGDQLMIHVEVEKIGTSSFTMLYNIYKEEDNSHVGQAKITHVTINKKTRQKIPIPEHLKNLLHKYLIPVM